MKIRGKLLIIQQALFVGFILAIGLMIFRYSRSYRLFRLELIGTQLMIETNAIKQDIHFLPIVEDELSVSYEKWLEDIDRFDSKLEEFINNKGVKLLDKELARNIIYLENTWINTKQTIINPYNDNIQAILDSGLYKSESRGIKNTLDLMELNGQDQEKLYLDLRSLLNSTGTIEAAIEGNIIAPLAELQSTLIAQINIFVRNAYISTLLISVLLLGGATAAGFIFSGRITKNIAEIEQTIAEIAKGNFDIHLEIKSDDEFGLLSEHFNTLTSELWGRLDALKDIMQDIVNSIEVEKEVDIDKFYEFILELAIDSTGAEAGVVLSPLEDDESYLGIKSMAGFYPMPMLVPTRTQADEASIIQYFKSHPIRIGETPYGKAAATQEPIFIRDNTVTNELEFNALSTGISGFFIQSVIIIPLVVSRKLLGVLALATKTEGALFSDLDFAYMRSYGDFVALTNDTLLKYLELLKKHELTREIEVAADIQKSLLPEKMPEMKRAAVHAFSNAAKGVSGDYYDVFMLDEDRMLIIVCDVSGKGVPASLLMIMIRTVLRTISSPEKNASRTLTELNRAITGRLGADRFATVGFFIFNQKKMEISYSNGAHHPLYIYRSDSGKFKMFDTDGLPLGIDINAAYGHKMIRVQSGDYLILFTDGLPEARNPQGEEMGMPMLLKFIAKNSGLEPKKLTVKVKKFLDHYISTAKQHDDETFLALKVF